MKKTLKCALLAAAALTAAASAQAQSTAYNGDLVLGLTAGSGNDLLLDLGSVSSLYSGETWNVSSQFSVSASTQWGVVGNTLNSGGRHTDNQIYSTTAIGFTPPAVSSSTYAAAQTAVASMYSLFSAAGAGNSLTIAANAASGNSWYEQTISPSLTTQYENAYENPNVTGYTADALWSVDDQGGVTTELGTFSLDDTGTVTFAQVPEPATYSLLAGFGLLAVLLRRKLRLNA